MSVTSAALVFLLFVYCKAQSHPTQLVYYPETSTGLEEAGSSLVNCVVLVLSYEYHEVRDLHLCNFLSSEQLFNFVRLEQ